MAQVRIDTSLAVLARPTAGLYYRKLPLASVASEPTGDQQVATRGYLVANRGSGSLSSAAVTARISTGLAPYATKDYVTQRDSLLATVAQVNAGDAGKLKLSQRNTANGIAGLDSAGRVDIARISAPSTQRWLKGYYTPTAYPTEAVSATGSTEATVFTLAVPDPGFDYRVLVNGHLDCHTATNDDAPVVVVRRGTTSGPIVARGTGSPQQYRYAVDTFNRTSPTLGAGWDAVYTGTGAGHAETTTKAFWVADGNAADRIGTFRKITDFATTVDDYQQISFEVADTIESGGIVGSQPHNRVYGRMKSDRSGYIAFDMTDTQCSLVCKSNGGEETVLVAPPNSGAPFYNPVTNFGLTAGDQIVAQFGYYAATNKRRFRLLRNGTVAIDYIDNALVSAIGSDYRGWGFGMQGGASLLFGQRKPAALDWIALSDPLATWNADPEDYAPAVIVPTDLTSQPTITGATTLYVRLRATSSATVSATTSYPRLHVMVIPA